VRSTASLTLNGRVAYRLDKATRIELEGFNLANRSAPAVEYYYVSRLQGEATARADVHFHPIEPRSLRLTLSRNW
jgi:hypothetical protein